MGASSATPKKGMRRAGDGYDAKSLCPLKIAVSSQGWSRTIVLYRGRFSVRSDRPSSQAHFFFARFAVVFLADRQPRAKATTR